ncbi:MAG: acyl-CoA dehydrogenase [Myxococcota bacterium]
MSTVHHYKSNLRDITFNLFEFLNIQQSSLGRGPYAAMDESSARDALIALEQLATTTLAESFAEADREPLRLDEAGNVFLPAGLKRSILAFQEAGWHRFDLPEHLGGGCAPPSLAWAAFELIAGSNPTAAFYMYGTFMVRMIDRLGTPEQVRRFMPHAIDRAWGGSMVLTEADAGSDVGASRTRARHLEGDVWELEGAKRFITSADFDAAENIIHLVLARPEGAGTGTKGLSLFIVPKFWVHEDGSLGERNGVYVTGIEKKMGIKGSATCELVFGAKHPARGILMGNVHDGIRQMFHVIEQARMAVGMKSIATASTGYLNALDYTKVRVQGSDLKQATDKNAPRVRIIEHPDVRRMLMHQKAHVEGMRALALFTASIQDQVELQGGHGAKEARGMDRLNDLLLPLVKGYSSEKAYELLNLALQCLGGSGYIQDYPIEQYVRDQKIDSLYEGTTHIQALDLFFRKVARDNGATLNLLLDQMRATLDGEAAQPGLEVERLALARALADVEAIFGTMMEKLTESLYHVGIQGNRILFAVAELVIGWLLVRQAALVKQKLPTASEDDRNFYTGKLASVRYYCQNVLPGITLVRKLVAAGTLELMDVPEVAF